MTAWSYSSLSTYRTCPKKYYHLRVAKDVKDSDSADSGEGKAVHTAMYNRVIKNIALPLPYAHFEKFAKPFAEMPGNKYGELKMALNKKLEPVDFFAKDVWVRAVADLVVVQGDTVVVVDWKTGKQKDDYEQLELTAAVVAQLMPEAERIKLVYVWLRDGVPTGKVVRRDELAEIWNKFYPEISNIVQAAKTTTFPAKPSGLCGWCPVKSCPHWVERG